MRSLPTPVSPHRRTLASVRAQIWIMCFTRPMAAERATISRSNVGGGQGGRRRRACLGRSLPPLDPRQQRENVLVAKGLGDKIERPQPHRLDGDGNAPVGGHDNDFHVGQRALLDPLEQFDAVQFRHFQVADDDVESPALEQPPCLLTVGGGDDLEALCGEIVGEGDTFDFFVVGDQDAHDGDRCRPPPPGPLSLRERVRVEGCTSR